MCAVMCGMVCSVVCECDYVRRGGSSNVRKSVIYFEQCA